MKQPESQADCNYHRYHLADRLFFSSGLVLGVAGGILMVNNAAFALVSTGLFTINSTLEFDTTVIWVRPAALS